MGSPPYAAVLRLASLAAEHWSEIDGEAAFNGVNLLDLRLDRFCNAILYWCYQRVEDRERLMFQLEQPIPGRVRQADVERELEDFSSFMSGFGGGG